MQQIKKILFQRLAKKGIDVQLMPGFIRSLSNSVCIYPHMSLSQLNDHLQYLGWNGIELDYHTLQLAIACLEDEGLKNPTNQPVGWFETNFSSHRPDTGARSRINRKASFNQG